MTDVIPRHQRKRIKTPTLLQMEAVECGAAALGIVLHTFGKYVTLEELRVACGVSRDGSNALSVIRAARSYGLAAKGVRRSNLRGVLNLPLPFIAFWKFTHFLVVEGFGKDRVYLNDPATGPRTVSLAEFDESFTGIALVMEPGPDFQPGGQPFRLINALKQRLRGAEWGVAYVILASLLFIIPGLAVPLFLRVFVDDLLVARRDWLEALLAGMALMALLQAGLVWLQQAYLLRLETRLAIGGSSRFLWHVLHLPVEFFAQRYAGDIAFRVQLNDRVAHLLSGELATAVIQVALTGFYAILMLYFDVWLTIISVGLMLLNVVVLRALARRRTDVSRNLLQERGKLVGASIDGLESIETLKATGAESDFFVRWSGFFTNVVNGEQRLGTLSQMLAVVPPFLQAISVAVVLVLGGWRVQQGVLSVGTLVAYQSLVLGISQPIIQLVNLGGRLQEAAGDLHRLDDVLRHPPDSLLQRAEIGDARKRLEGSLELRQVTFGYNRLGEPLIDDFTLKLEPGQRVALVGASGSGKSTVARLVAGLYQPWRGDILFDGQPRMTIPRSVMSASVAMVDQDILLFSGTIRDNLTLWNPAIPMSWVVEAAKDACIHDVITEHPGGYDFEVQAGGRNFSGGERQRLEIARALTTNPSILILDEATSALDPVTEKEIDDHLRRRGCTCLIVAHRLSTIRDCDEIIVLDKGKIVQRGTHQQMIREGGPYAALIGAEQPSQRRSVLESALDNLLDL